jgi:hypothetical protein
MKIMKKLLKFKNKLILEMKYNKSDKDKASEIACELLREHFLDESNEFDDNWIIEKYTDEWSWFMQGWMECVNSQH